MSSTIARKIQTYPALEEMGITRAHQISQYTLRADGADKDILKIRYVRTKGSLLPESRTYKFGRSLKTVIADGGTARMEHTYEISPFLLRAIAELDSLVDNNKKINDKVKSMIGSERVAEIVSEIDELELLVSSQVSMTDAAAISAKFSRLKSRIAAL